MAIKDVIEAQDNYGWNADPSKSNQFLFDWMQAVTKELQGINNYILSTIDEKPGLADIYLWEEEND